MKIKQTIREFCLWPQDAAGMRLGKTNASKLGCFCARLSLHLNNAGCVSAKQIQASLVVFVLDFHYICPVKIVA